MSTVIEAAASAQACANCGGIVTAAYCGDCGQRRVSDHDLTVRHFVSHGLHELTHLESNRIVRTVRDLFLPGRLTAAYVEGRRGRHISPLRLYLTISALFFLLAWNTTLERTGMTANVMRTLEQFAEARHLQAEAVSERFFHDFSRAAALVRFGNVLALGGLLLLVFRRRKQYYVQHLIFALHVVCFQFLLGIVWSLLRLSEALGLGLSQLLQVGLLALYTYAAMRHVYRQSRGSAGATAGLFVLADVALFYLTFVVAAMTAMGLLLLRQ